MEELIDGIVREAHIPTRAAREDLRRELAVHFEDAVASPEGLEDALRRFGNPQVLTTHFRDIYHWDYIALYFAKLAASVIASVAVALVVQVFVNLRVEIQTEALRLAPGFSKGASVSVAVVLGLVTLWEIGRRPFDGRRAAVAIAAYATISVAVQWFFASGLEVFGPATVLVLVGYASSRLEQRPAKLLRTFGLFVAATYLVHVGLSVPLAPGRAALASAALIAVWASTVAILSRFDHAFFNVFTPAGRE
ncbi:MAG: hypothetical protein K2Y23_09950 [Cyanobacteria bacterium]|nr:hypothetical protein [Cyanobacteriota bacterium]